MDNMWKYILTSLLTVNLVFIAQARGITIPIVDDKTPIPQPGRVCSYGDMNKDRYTDLVVQRGSKLSVLLQSESGTFKEDSKHGVIDLGRTGEVYCSVGDFDGQASPDILVTRTTKEETFKSSIYIQNERGYTEIPLNQTYVDQPFLLDVNGDGISDIVGFVKNESRFAISCISGSRASTYEDCSYRFIDADFSSGPVKFFPHIFVDLDKDLSSEIIFGLNDSKLGLQLSVWKLDSADFKWRNHKDFIPALSDNPDFRYFAAPLVNDFNSDGINDILIPICKEPECKHVDRFLVWFYGSRWETFQLDMKDAEIITEPNSIVAFRVGEFDLDGYPDLIATVRMNNILSPIILNNAQSDNGNFSRKFEINSQKDFRIILPPEMSKGQIVLSSFFDLKEDGNLDILVEYKADVGTFFDFIKCDDKGDTTFLKVQIFSNLCADCPGTSSSDKGSGIAWAGACGSFSMSTSTGPPRVAVQCQLPQSSHRVFHSPFILFGLGRSPNFVDEVVLGSPRWPEKYAGNQKHMLKQIVPNSRIVVVPPERDDKIWQVRLYITPSQLIIQSLLVQISVCVVLSCLAIGLHLKEQQADKKERQQQSHRFHFNAL